MSTRTKMYSTNGEVRKKLVGMGYEHLYSFPHLRFSKDFILENNIGFDLLATYNNKICFIQIKSHCRPSQLILEQYKLLEEKYGIRCMWINKEKKTTTTLKGIIKIYPEIYNGK